MPRKTRARFIVMGRIDNAHMATLTIDEAAGLVSVRPYRRRREYTLPLERLCRMIVFTVAAAEHEEMLQRRRRTRTASRGLLRASRRR